jgi:DNA-binding LytR/AlgR family response regulator
MEAGVDANILHLGLPPLNLAFPRLKVVTRRKYFATISIALLLSGYYFYLKLMEASVNMEENRQTVAERPVSFISDGFFVKPINYDVKIKINYDDIVWVEAENSHSHIHLKRSPYVSVAHNIHSIELILPRRSFVRISRSEIVNITLVNKRCGNALYLRDCTHIFTVTKAYRDYVYSCFVELL